MAELQPKPYRPNIKFQLVNGKYPLKLDYSDFVAFDGLKTTAGQPFPLSAGMELEYWLEARRQLRLSQQGRQRRREQTVQADH